MTGAIQVLNSEHDDIQRTAFLSLMDRNFVFAARDHTNETNISSTAHSTIPFTFDLGLHPPEMFSFASSIITLSYAGFFKFSYRLNIGNGSGATGTTVVSTWLEWSPDNGGGFVELPGTRAHVYAPPAQYNTVYSEIMQRILAEHLPVQFRVRATVVAPGGTQTAQVFREGRVFQAMSLYAANQVE